MGNRYYYGIVHQNSLVGEPNTQGLKVYFPMLIDNKLWPWYNPILSLLYFQEKEFFSTVVLNITKVSVNYFANLKAKNVTRSNKTFFCYLGRKIAIWHLVCGFMTSGCCKFEFKGELCQIHSFITFFWLRIFTST